MQQEKKELHYTYLDTVGRPVIVLKKNDVVENHIQDMEVRSLLFVEFVFNQDTSFLQ